MNQENYLNKCSVCRADLWQKLRYKFNQIQFTMFNQIKLSDHIPYVMENKCLCREYDKWP